MAPYILKEIELQSNTAKTKVKTTHMVYVPPSKLKAEDELAPISAKQLPELAEKYPKEYDAELGYIGGKKKAEPKE